eukprot:7620464-Lingulodinium_polyedra.AAC.1
MNELDSRGEQTIIDQAQQPDTPENSKKPIDHLDSRDTEKMTKKPQRPRCVRLRPQKWRRRRTSRRARSGSSTGAGPGSRGAAID